MYFFERDDAQSFFAGIMPMRDRDRIRVNLRDQNKCVGYVDHANGEYSWQLLLSVTLPDGEGNVKSMIVEKQEKVCSS